MCFVSSIEYGMSVAVQESQPLSSSVPAIHRVGKSRTQKFKLHHLLKQLHSVRENRAETVRSEGVYASGAGGATRGHTLQLTT